MEEWKHPLLQGELVRREDMLDEIKKNIIAVIADYKDLPPLDSPLLTMQAERLFTGQVVPSRDDWENLTEMLRELATVKEQGQMYEHFISDVSDSLGVSDLEQIRDFIDYIQTLPPVASNVSVVLTPPVMYNIQNIDVQNINQWSQVKLDWTLSDNYLNNPTGHIRLDRSVSEDIDRYRFTIEAGSHRATFERNATANLEHSFPLAWREWFTPQELNDVWLSVQIETIDKRGNETSFSTSGKYPASVRIPQGVLRYEVQYQLDSNSWVEIGRTTNRTLTWDIPRVNGNYRWRVRAIDRNGQETPWLTTGTRFIRFIPDPPPAPTVSVSTTVREATVTWDAAPRADYYEIWHGGEKWAKDNTRGSNTYWARVNANQTRRVVMGQMNEGETYTWYVRAVNEGGSNIGSRKATMKRRVLKTATYNKNGQRVWRGSYERINKDWTRIAHKAGWRTPSYLWQGHWHDANWSSSGNGWFARSGGSYWAYGGQTWGNHMSFSFFNYTSMRNTLRGKDIQKVTIRLTRASGGFMDTHGHAQSTPLYLYNHNRELSDTSTNNLTLYRQNRVAVRNDNQQALASVVFQRGQTRAVSNNGTKRLIQNIVDGHMKGLGIVKYYGNNFNARPPAEDRAYTIFSNNVSIEVEYYDIQ